MAHVLIVDNSESLIASLARHIEAELGFSAVAATSLAEAEKIIGENKGGFLAGIVGLLLEDASGMEIVDSLLIRAVPTIVFTGTVDAPLRRELNDRAIVDYVPKDSPVNLELIVSLLKRLHRNPGFEVLLAEGHEETQAHLRQMLSALNYDVISADDAKAATKAAKAHPDIPLMVIGDNLGMDQLEMLKTLRRGKPASKTAILAVTRQPSRELVADLFNYGAADVLHWPLGPEEFNSRVIRATEMLECNL